MNEAARVGGAARVDRAARVGGATRRRSQKYDGTDRQCRGRVLAVLRAADDPVRRADFDAVWAERAQLERALDGLVADGLVDPLPDGRFTLPGGAAVAMSPGRKERETCENRTLERLDWLCSGQPGAAATPG